MESTFSDPLSVHFKIIFTIHLIKQFSVKMLEMLFLFICLHICVRVCTCARGCLWRPEGV